MDTRSAVPTLSLNPRDARGILRANESRLTLLATSYQSGAVEGRNLGHNGYSYDFVMRQFAPLLQGCAGFEIVAGGAEEVARRAAELAKSGRRAAHIGFRALHEFELVAGIPNIAVPAWEFPDIPREPSGGSARHDWVGVANACDFVIQLCEFTRGAFERAGVTTPMAVAPVPVTPRYFDVKAWNPRQSLTIETPALVLDGETSQVAKPAQDSSTGKTTGTQSRSGLGAALRLVGEGYKKLVRPLLPWWLDRGLAAGAREALSRRASRQFGQVRESSQVTLSGVVYTSVFNPYDRRKNWEDLLSGFLLALGDRADVTL
ncbi:MAG: hypothetical protein EHM42_09385, partial [Planctomycetaceae bacterium]